MRLGRALGEVTSKLGGGRADVITAVFGAWSDIVGPAVAAHVRPSRIDDATLIVDADHPAWATQVRHLSAEILERVRDVCGAAGAPERIDVRVRA